jgi:Zn-dependent protease with chaperone function
MATRIVERGVQECRSEAQALLEERGYAVRSHEDRDDVVLTGDYVQKDRQGMLWRPFVEVRFGAPPGGKTCVAFSALPRWGLMAGVAAFWVSLGCVPLVVFCIVTWHAGRDFAAAHIWWFRAGAAFSFVWLVTLTCGKGQRGASAFDDHLKALELALWDRLDPDGSASYEISSQSQAELTFWRGIRKISFYSVILGALLWLSSYFVPASSSFAESLLEQKDRWVQFVMLLWVHLLGIIEKGIGLLMLILGGVIWVYCNWLIRSWYLPHRYHWKARLYVACADWWTVTSLPILILAPNLVPSSSEGAFALVRPIAVASVLFLQGLMLASMLGLLRTADERRHAAGSYDAPSTRYEETGTSTVSVDGLRAKHRAWTWATSILLGVLFYGAAGVVVSAAIQSTGLMWGAPWAGEGRCIPFVLPLGRRGIAIQGLVFTALMATPLAITIVQIVRLRLRLHGRLRLVRLLARPPEDLCLPTQPLQHLREQLRARLLHVALLPTPTISVSIESVSVRGHEYVLCVSSGALSSLSKEEVESVLWHECSHAHLVRQSRLRSLALLLMPWAPRLLDLAEDLYEEERRADAYAVQKMGGAQVLLSSLGKMMAEQETTERLRKTPLPAARISWGALRTIGEPGWAGYLYPDIEQRIRWLEQDLEMA